MQDVLIRDINDEYYPRKDDCPNFLLNPKWGKYSFQKYSISGVWFQIRMHYGYFNSRTKEWDIFEGFDSNKMVEEFEKEKDLRKKMERNIEIRNFWTHLPFSSQVEVSVWAHLKYDHMLLIDDKGDFLNKTPHIYADYRFQYGPFNRILNVIGKGVNTKPIDHEGGKRINVFPKTFPPLKSGKTYKNEFVHLSENSNKLFNKIYTSQYSIFDLNRKYDFLNPGDVISIKVDSNPETHILVKFTCKYTLTVKEYYEENLDNYRLREQLATQLDKKPADDEKINVYEFITHFSSE
jgi:TusA-related sulfurtransferase